MNILKALLYGLISGITEILPVSSSGHQAVFRKVFGETEHFGIYNIFIHIGILLALLYACKPLLHRIRSSSRRSASGDRRVVKDATLPFVIVSVVLMMLCSATPGLLWIALLFIINGIILYLPSRMASGNKDSRSMSLLDSVLIGAFGGLSMLPGLSRIGIMASVASARGSSRQYGVIWSLALSVPAMVILIIADIYSAITQGITFYFSQFAHYLFAMVGAFCGCCIAVRVLRRLIKSIDLSALSYYSWGMALLTFILYLMI